MKRYKAICSVRDSGKTLREVANLFGISEQRVCQIVAKYERTLQTQREMRGSPDPLAQALGNGRVSRKVYNSLVRGGYGKTFDFENLGLVSRAVIV
jgi:hypothetical protein